MCSFNKINAESHRSDLVGGNMPENIVGIRAHSKDKAVAKKVLKRASKKLFCFGQRRFSSRYYAYKCYWYIYISHVLYMCMCLCAAVVILNSSSCHSIPVYLIYLVVTRSDQGRTAENVPKRVKRARVLIADVGAYTYRTVLDTNFIEFAKRSSNQAPGIIHHKRNCALPNEITCIINNNLAPTGCSVLYCYCFYNKSCRGQPVLNVSARADINSRFRNICHM